MFSFIGCDIRAAFLLSGFQHHIFPMALPSVSGTINNGWIRVREVPEAERFSIIIGSERVDVSKSDGIMVESRMCFPANIIPNYITTVEATCSTIKSKNPYDPPSFDVYTFPLLNIETGNDYLVILRSKLPKYAVFPRDFSTKNIALADSPLPQVTCSEIMWSTTNPMTTPRAEWTSSDPFIAILKKPRLPTCTSIIDLFHKTTTDLHKARTGHPESFSIDTAACMVFGIIISTTGLKDAEVFVTQAIAEIMHFSAQLIDKGITSAFDYYLNMFGEIEATATTSSIQEDEESFSIPFDKAPPSLMQYHLNHSIPIRQGRLIVWESQLRNYLVTCLTEETIARMKYSKFIATCRHRFTCDRNRFMEPIRHLSAFTDFSTQLMARYRSRKEVSNISIDPATQREYLHKGIKLMMNTCGVRESEYKIKDGPQITKDNTAMAYVIWDGCIAIKCNKRGHGNNEQLFAQIRSERCTEEEINVRFYTFATGTHEVQKSNNPAYERKSAFIGWVVIYLDGRPALISRDPGGRESTKR